MGEIFHEYSSLNLMHRQEVIKRSFRLGFRTVAERVSSRVRSIVRNHPRSISHCWRMSHMQSSYANKKSHPAPNIAHSGASPPPPSPTFADPINREIKFTRRRKHESQLKSSGWHGFVKKLRSKIEAVPERSASESRSRFSETFSICPSHIHYRPRLRAA